MESSDHNTWTFTQERMDEQIVHMLKHHLRDYLGIDRDMRGATKGQPFMIATHIKSVTYDEVRQAYDLDVSISVEPFRDDGRAFYRQVMGRHHWDREWLMWFVWETTEQTTSPTMPFSLDVATALGTTANDTIPTLAMDILSEEKQALHPQDEERSPEDKDGDGEEDEDVFPVTLATLQRARTCYGLYTRTAQQIGEALTGRSVIRSTVMSTLYNHETTVQIDPEVKSAEDWAARFVPDKYGYTKPGHKRGPSALYVLFRDKTPVAWFQYRANYTLQTLEVLLAYAAHTSPHVTSTIHDVLRAMQRDHGSRTVTVMKPPHTHWLEAGGQANAYAQWFGAFPGQFKSFAERTAHGLYLGSVS